MNRRITLYERYSANQPELANLGTIWSEDAISRLIGYVWSGCDNFLGTYIQPVTAVSEEDRSLERTLNSLLDPCIQDQVPRESPFFFQHKPDEMETLVSDQAQPPEPDFGFRERANPLKLWAIEAKVLPGGGAVAEYVKEVTDNFLTCRYSPLVPSGAMIGYLLKGTPSNVFRKISNRLSCQLDAHSNFVGRPHRVSNHIRRVPEGKRYVAIFACHHMIVEVGPTRNRNGKVSSVSGFGIQMVSDR